MYKKSFFAVLLLLMISLLIVSIFPVNGWDYTDETTPNDYNYEKFGPRADKLLIKLYSDAEAEWDALDAGEIDITDWPLTKSYYDKFTTPPEDAYIETMYYGAEFNIRLLDINWNNNEYLGNPPDPAYPNPVYPNPCSYVNMRKAIWYLHNKPAWLPTIIGIGFYEDIYTVVPSCFGAFHKPMANPYPYDPAAAIAELETDEDGDTMPDFPWEDKNDDTIRDESEVYWDIDGNGENDGGDEELCIIFVVRSDDIHRLSVANKLIAELRAIGICVDARYGPVANAYTLWFYGKAAHLYTADWSLAVDPDHIILWNYFFYWHPGFCYNTGAVNDPILNDASWAVMLANTESDALVNCLAFQDRFDDVAAAVPWWSYSGTMAMSRKYTGGTGGTPVGDAEDQYRDKYWDGMVNVPGYGLERARYGLDSYFSFLNMHPRGEEYGDGKMTIRYGFKTSELKSFNPVYAEWVWEWAVLGQIYDSLLARDPYTLQPGCWMASNYAVENYDHPVSGTCTKVTFTLRSDVYWVDGKQLTTADIMFTFVELDDILLGRGLPPPRWYDSVAMILSFSILDAYNFEVLFDTKSVYYLMRAGGTVILPKQIWKPLAETGPVDSLVGDPNMVGSGPWRFKEYMACSHVLMVANKPNSTVTTSHEGSTPVTSTKGYFRAKPFNGYGHVQCPPEYERRYKLPGEIGAQIGFEIYNEQVNFDIDGTYTADVSVDGEPVGHAENGFSISHVTEPCSSHSFDLGIEMTSWACGMITCSGYWHQVDDFTYKVHKECEGKVNAGTIINVYYSIDGEKSLLYSFTVTVSGRFKFVIQLHFTLPMKIGEICKKYWFCNCTRYWFTIKEDIVGSTFYDDIGVEYAYKKQLPTPDFKVDIKDVALAAKAFGAYPGHPRWSTIADIIPDYKIDIKDIAGIAKKYGWVCTP